MATLTTSEVFRTAVDAPPFCMIEQKGLLVRLADELRRAGSDFLRDPGGFVREIFSSEARDKKRQRRIQIGLAGALLAHGLFLALLFGMSWHTAAITEKKTEYEYVVTEWVAPPPSEPGKPPEPATEAPKPDRPRGSNGGGGGGQNNPIPASKGVLPPSLPTPPRIALTAPSSPNPVLPVIPSIMVSETAPPPPDATIGLPTGKAGAPSGGPGAKGGLGSGQGPSAGQEQGLGSNSGKGGGTGSDTAGDPAGSATSLPKSFNYGDFAKVPENAPFKWIYRPTPVVTPEAEQQKVSGVVLLQATLRADGTVSDIQVRQTVPYMTESAVEALRKSRFHPATVQGRPVTLRNVIIKINVTVGQR